MDDLEKIVYIKGEELTQSVLRYRNIMNRLEADVDIRSLCLPKKIENKLLRMGCLRILDVIDLDLTKVKGIGPRTRGILHSSINQFLSMGL